MKILITGGAGFIGSNFIRHILTKYPDYQIVNLDKLTYAGNLENLKDIEDNPHYTFIKGDICEKPDLAKAIGRGVDGIINFAAMTHVDRSILDPDAFVKTDIFGVKVLLEATRHYKIERFIQISSDEVYGSIQQGSFTEESSLNPSNPYAASKAGGDLLCRAYYKTYDTPIIITRSSNNYGPYQYPEKVIPLFITNLLEGKKMPLYGDGLNVRDWLFVLDSCTAIDLVLHKGKIGEIYNVGAGCEKTNLEVARTILKILGKEENQIEYIKDRPGHDRRYSLNFNKIKKLGWCPKYSFDKGIRETILWYQENQDWWKKIKSGQFLRYYKKQYQGR